MKFYAFKEGERVKVNIADIDYRTELPKLGKQKSFDRYFRLRFGSTNATSNYLRLKIFENKITF